MKLLLFWILSFICLNISAITSAQKEPHVVCYYTSWSIYREGNAKYNPENINPNLCTHLIYAFGGFTLEDNTLQPFDKNQDIENGGYVKFTGLKTSNKNLKTLLSIGGWNEGSTRFSSLVGDADKRRAFIKNAITYLRRNNFDGLDLDWQYPTFRDDGKLTDRANYAQFAQELREEFDRESSTTELPRLLLTVAIPASVGSIDQGFDVVKLNQYIDWFNVLTFDYHDSSESATNHHAPLYPLEEDDEDNDDGEINIDFSVKHLIKVGADRQKLVLGIPTHGRTFKLFHPDANKIGAPADGPGAPSNTTEEEGFLAYFEICQNIKNDDNWTVVHPNDNAMGPYSYKDDQWISYDDENIARKKGQYAANNGLGGIMFWAIDTDDFNGTCSGKLYPLIEAAKEGLYDALRNNSTDSEDIRVMAAPLNRPTLSPKVSNESPTNITPKPPTMADPGSGFICEGEGYFSHPKDCKKYFWCSDSGSTILGIQAIQLTCPSDLVFNKQVDSCDHAQNVICKNTQTSTTTTVIPKTAPSAITLTRLSTTERTITLRATSIRPMTTKSPAKEEPRVVCYYTNWSVYREGNAKYNPENINPYLCTHLIYAFGGFTLEDNTLQPFDKNQDIENGGYVKFTGLKTSNKNLKTLLSIGGWNEGSTRFSPLVDDADKRRTFIKNAIIFLRQNEFDGLDLDWQYPTFRDDGKLTDRANYAQFAQELREEFDRESSTTELPRLILTVAIPSRVGTIDQGFDVVKLNQYIDWFNVLTFDYHDSSESATNHHAPLYPLEEDDEDNDDGEINIDFSVNHLINAGADRQKLVLGIPTYGRSFKLFNPDANNIGAPADGPGPPGNATEEEGFLAYFEICQNIKNDDNWTIVHPNDNVMGPYSYKDNQWISYDDENIARKKGQYAANNGLGGIMFWTIDTDDFNGTCSVKLYPLIEAAKEGLYDALRNNSTDSKDIRVTAAPLNRPTESPTVITNSPTSLKPERTITPDPSGDFICDVEGFFPHPKDCKKYFWCSGGGSANLGIMTHQFTCPSDLVFNKQVDSCDHARNVICENTQPSTGTTIRPQITSSQTITRLSTTERTKTLRISTNRPTTTTTTTTSAYDNDDKENKDEIKDAKVSNDRRPIPQTSRLDNLSFFDAILKEKPKYVTIQKHQTSIKIVW